MKPMGVAVVDRYDDELAERRAGARRAGGQVETPEPPGPRGGPAASAAPGALPLQWDEADCDDDDPDDGDFGDEHRAETIDLTERVSRDDFNVWTDVLRRRPAETAARLSSHPSAAGERLRQQSRDRDDFAEALMERRRQRSRGERPEGPPPEAPAPPPAESGEAQPAGPAPRGRASGIRRPTIVSRLRPDGSGEGEPGRKRGIGADLRSRVVTGALVAAVCLLVFNAGRAPAALLCALVIGVGVVELCTGLRAQGHRPAVVIALAGSVALVLGGYNAGESAYPFVLALVALSTLLWYLFQVVPAGRPAPGIAMTFLAFGYVGVLGGFAGLLLGFPNGVGMLLGTALCTVAGDVGAYFVGRKFGRRKLTAISPNKTMEGLAGGAVASVVAGAVLAGAIHPWDFPSGLALGLVVAVVAPLGDLCESMLKRDLELKDLGGILPGHGGVLDRFDTILFALPAAYYLVRFLDIL